MSNENTCYRQFEDAAAKCLAGETLRTALDFSAYMQENGITPFGPHGAVCYRDNVLCYMLLDEGTDMPAPWTIWPEGDFNEEPTDALLDNDMKEAAWAHVNFCTDCGCGNPGGDKVVFGRLFEKVCNSVFVFYMPDAAALECVKRLFAIKMRAYDAV